VAADYVYDVATVYNADTGAIAKNASGYFLAVLGGDPQPMYDINGSPIAEITSNGDGVSQRFRADVLQGYLKFGDIVLPIKSIDLYDLAANASGLAATATQAAGDAASAASSAQTALTQLQALIAGGGGGAGGLDVTTLESRLGGAPNATAGLIPRLATVRVKGADGVWPPKNGIGAAADIAIGTAPGPTDQDANGDVFLEVAL
jgi:hypothetical protein